MASPKDVEMKEGGDDGIHEAFTSEEHIRQLNAIDRSIVRLMDHTAVALNTLTMAPATPTSASVSSEPTPTVDNSRMDAASRKQAFRDATDSFLNTLHEVDVHLKRQIFALEEIGIINLSSAQRQDPNTRITIASVKPNGVGSVGGLDVGWLNSRGTKVERDMESETWKSAREFLEGKEEQGRTDKS